jgi:hypothetical protein
MTCCAGTPTGGGSFGSLVLVGGALFVALHAVSDIGITGSLGAKLASFGFQHDQGLAYMLYLMTYGLDSVGDVFGSVFAVAAGVLVIDSGPKAVAGAPPAIELRHLRYFVALADAGFGTHRSPRRPG